MKIPYKLIGPLHKYHLQKKKVLDIGSGHGEALNLFGPGSVGIEPDKSRGIDSKNTGKKVLHVNFEDDFKLNETFDAVWISHVLEHVTSPLLVLNKINHLLENKKGLVFVSVPLISRYNPLNYLYNKVVGTQGWNANIHSYAFTSTSVRFLLKNAGFKVIEEGFLLSKNNLVNKTIGWFVSLALAQKTFVAVRDDRVPKPRIYPPKKYEKIIRHQNNYVHI